MDAFLQRVFEDEVQGQCRFIVAADNDLLDAMGRATGEPEESLVDMWRHAQTILVSSANLYKLFWGSRGKLETKREPLRRRFAVADDSILRDPTIRNDFEHYDERLEEWWARSTQRVYIGRTVGLGRMVPMGAEDEAFQHLDPFGGFIYFWDRQVSFRDLVDEARRILALA